MSFLEMLDVVNEGLVESGQTPIAFDHDCREGICGSCGMMINGVAHGPMKGTATCQLHMRSFTDGATIYIEPWRSQAFPVIKDLGRRTAARSTASLRRAVSSPPPPGGARDANTSSDPEAGRGRRHGRRRLHRLRRVRRRVSERVGVAVHRGEDLAPRAAAAGPARAHSTRRARWWRRWTKRASAHCTLFGECQEACPKDISIDTIARMNRDYIVSTLSAREEKTVGGTG